MPPTPAEELLSGSPLTPLSVTSKWTLNFVVFLTSDLPAMVVRLYTLNHYIHIPYSILVGRIIGGLRHLVDFNLAVWQTMSNNSVRAVQIACRMLTRRLFSYVRFPNFLGYVMTSYAAVDGELHAVGI